MYHKNSCSIKLFCTWWHFLYNKVFNSINKSHQNVWALCSFCLICKGVWVAGLCHLILSVYMIKIFDGRWVELSWLNTPYTFRIVQRIYITVSVQMHTHNRLVNEIKSNKIIYVFYQATSFLVFLFNLFFHLLSFTYPDS